MAISKRDMAGRVAKAASAAPGLEDRLRHASELAHTHPAPDTHPEPHRQSAAPHSEDSKEGRFMVVPIDLIDPNPYNARKIYRPERVSEIAASIGTHGQDIPGIATSKKGRYVLAAGHYRLRAIKVLGLQTMNLMVHPNLTDKELFAYSYRENAEREGQSALDNALCWSDLLTQEVFLSEMALAEAIGLSLPTINKTLKILKLSEPVLDVIKEDPATFAMSALYELTLYEDVAGQAAALEMAKLLKAGEAGRKDVQDARARVAEPKGRKRKETSRPYRIEKTGAYSGSLKVFADSGRVTLDVVFIDPADREATLADLKTRFGVTE